LCDLLWLIAAIEHYTAAMGDFAFNCAWDDHGADPTMVDLFRRHGSEEVEHRDVAHDVAVYFHDSYVDRIRAMAMAVVMIAVFYQRGMWCLTKADPTVLTDPERESAMMLVCISRAAKGSHLTLDL
jgi:predicted metal-dependent hydrolase